MLVWLVTFFSHPKITPSDITDASSFYFVIYKFELISYFYFSLVSIINICSGVFLHKTQLKFFLSNIKLQHYMQTVKCPHGIHTTSATLSKHIVQSVIFVSLVSYSLITYGFYSSHSTDFEGFNVNQFYEIRYRRIG